MSATYIKIQTTARQFANSYKDAFSVKDASVLSSALTPDCKRHVLPSSFLASQGMEAKPISNAEFEAIIRNEFPAFKSCEASIVRTSVDETQKSASLIVEQKCVLTDGREYALDFAYFLDLTDDCDRIKAVTQFMDTTKFVETRVCIREVLSAKQA